MVQNIESFMNTIHLINCFFKNIPIFNQFDKFSNDFKTYIIIKIIIFWNSIFTKLGSKFRVVKAAKIRPSFIYLVYFYKPNDEGAKALEKYQEQNTFLLSSIILYTLVELLETLQLDNFCLRQQF